MSTSQSPAEGRMFLIIEIDAFADAETALRYLSNMQAESDEALAEDPEDGQGSLSLSTPHMGVDARIIGIQAADGTVAPLESK